MEVCKPGCAKKKQNLLIVVLKPALSGGIMVAFLVSGSNYQHLRYQQRTLLTIRV